MNAPVITAGRANDPMRGEQDRTGPAEAKRKRLPASLVFSFLFVVTCGLAAWHLLDPGTLPIRHVRIKGNFQHLSTDRMQSMVTAVLKGGFFNLNVMTIKEALLSEPWVNWVAVQRVWPDGLSVHIEEQQPVAHWNGVHLLNGEAGIFSPQSASSAGGLPYLSGPEGSEQLVYRRYREITRALERTMVVTSLALSERRAWSVKLQDGPLVILGRKAIDSRIDRLTGPVVKTLGKEISRVGVIDLRYTNGFAIQWCNDILNPIEQEPGNNG